MTRLALLALAAGLLICVPAPARTTAVGVSLREWAVAPYRDFVRPGRVKLNVQNYGEDAHDLAVLRRGRLLGQVPELRPGERATLRLRLRRPGRYRLVCTLPGHEERGMRARLTVR